MASMFHEDCVLLNIEAYDKYEILSKLSDTLYRRGFVKDTFKQAVIGREEKFPTGLRPSSMGVAIPHTDAVHVNQTSVGVAVLKNPVRFSLMGSQGENVPVSIIFMLAMGDGQKQLEMLTKLIEFFQREEELKKMQRMTSEKEVVTFLESELLKN
ncbi:MAG: PTS sugar transporter subunit IIA [Bacillaceae bacterium]